MVSIRRLLRRRPAIVLALAATLAAATIGGAAGIGEIGGGSPGLEGPEGPHAAEVVRVIDGDTIVVRIAGRTERVRYIGIDTPETVKPGTPVECFGPEANAANERLVAESRVRLQRDTELRDRYGRLLAYVYADRALVNEELVRRGYATTLEIEPNTGLAARLAAAERSAEAADRGLWGHC